MLRAEILELIGFWQKARTKILHGLAPLGLSVTLNVLVCPLTSAPGSFPASPAYWKGQSKRPELCYRPDLFFFPFLFLDGVAPTVMSQLKCAESDATWPSMSSGRTPANTAIQDMKNHSIRIDAGIV